MNSRFESFYYCCQSIFHWITCRKPSIYTKNILEPQDDCPYKRYPSEMI